jgi:hypothetical protein
MKNDCAIVGVFPQGTHNAQASHVQINRFGSRLASRTNGTLPEACGPRSPAAHGEGKKGEGEEFRRDGPQCRPRWGHGSQARLQTWPSLPVARPIA